MCVGAKRERLFSRAARRALNPTFDVTELPGIQRVEIIVNGFRVFARICIPIYSTENISFFFFPFLPTRFYRIEISFLENHVFRVKRTIEIPSKSVDLFPFSLTIPNTSNHIFIAQRLSRSKTHN